ncbi:MAG TPA: Xaa-Pro peptidase family protein [Solirubrobacteraceae bacterium]|jgi:Xaa-Pro aminopeptidase
MAQLMDTARDVSDSTPPFDQEFLDSLMLEARIDALFVTSRHNIQYLAGHRFFWQVPEEAVGVGRYLPVLCYRAGHPEDCFYVAQGVEQQQLALDPIWVPTTYARGREHPAGLHGAPSSGAWTDANFIERCADCIRAWGLEKGVIGIEAAFLPVDAYLRLTAALPEAQFVDAVPELQELRGIKSPQEVALIRHTCENIVDSMLATFGRAHAGITMAQVSQLMREEAASRGLRFDVCFTTNGPDANRVPSAKRTWEPGGMLSLDSGCSYAGYMGDLARMGVLGEPSAEQTEFLAAVTEVQRKARAVVRPGVPAREVYRAGEAAIAESSYRDLLTFQAHGDGLAHHEFPRLDPRSPHGYSPVHGFRALQPGVTLSIETWLIHPTGGFVKIEDYGAVSEDGFDAFADRARGFTVVEV